MEFKSQDIFLYILPGLYFIINLFILLVGLKVITITDIWNSVTIASSILIILFSMLVGYIIQIIFYIFQGKVIGSVKIDMLYIKTDKTDKRIIDTFNRTLEDLNNSGMFFVTNSIVFLMAFTGLVVSYETKIKVFICQLVTSILLMIVTSNLIKIKKDEISDLIKVLKIK